MPGDRVAELRAASAKPETAAPNYEMSNVSATGATHKFLDEITVLQASVHAYSENISHVVELHSRSLNAIDAGASAAIAVQLNTLSSETTSQGNEIRLRLKELAGARVSVQEAQLRQHHITRVKNLFMDALRRYERVQTDFRSRTKARLERQFKIVKPDATPDEVATMINSESPETNQIFVNALSNLTNYAASRNARNSVQERHEDMLRIERTLIEVAQLFNDMETLVILQDETIDHIGQTTAGVQNDTERAHADVDKAVISARNARRLRVACFVIILIIVVVLALVLGIYFGLHDR